MNRLYTNSYKFNSSLIKKHDKAFSSMISLEFSLIKDFFKNENNLRTFISSNIEMIMLTLDAKYNCEDKRFGIIARRTKNDLFVDEIKGNPLLSDDNKQLFNNTIKVIDNETRISTFLDEIVIAFDDTEGKTNEIINLKLVESSYLVDPDFFAEEIYLATKYLDFALQYIIPYMSKTENHQLFNDLLSDCLKELVLED